MNPQLPMEETVSALVCPGKGLLAADESFKTIETHFKDYNIPSTEETRRAYRELLFTTPGLSEFISGIILFDETIRQKFDDVLVPEILVRQGIIPGIKVDKGTVPLAGFPGEKITQGLDGLAERLGEYRQLGARFTKWRAVISIGDCTPTNTCLQSNADALARFALLSQEAGLVPIVEPEVLMDGSHTLARCEEVTRETLNIVFGTLYRYRVNLEQMLLKTNMILSGSQSAEKPDLLEVAAATLRCLRRTVPLAVPGIVFLSGGQSDLSATQHLQAICSVHDPAWKLSYSFGRALQAQALQVWKGLPANVKNAQTAFHTCAQANSFALQSRFQTDPKR